MSKAVLISIRPKWCEKIINGDKTIEVRKTRPKMNTPFKCYIYCTRGTPYLNRHNGHCYLEKQDVLGGRGTGLYERLSGKVIGEFVCDDCSRLTKAHYGFVEKQGCISRSELKAYIGIGTDRELSYSDGCYGWHISDLVIYDRPKTLYHFRKALECHQGNYKDGCVCCWDCQIKRAPQSWCYVEELKGGDEG